MNSLTDVLSIGITIIKTVPPIPQNFLDKEKCAKIKGYRELLVDLKKLASSLWGFC